MEPTHSLLRAPYDAPGVASRAILSLPSLSEVPAKARTVLNSSRSERAVSLGSMMSSSFFHRARGLADQGLAKTGDSQHAAGLAARQLPEQLVVVGWLASAPCFQCTLFK